MKMSPLHSGNMKRYSRGGRVASRSRIEPALLKFLFICRVLIELPGRIQQNHTQQVHLGRTRSDILLIENCQGLSSFKVDNGHGDALPYLILTCLREGHCSSVKCSGREGSLSWLSSRMMVPVGFFIFIFSSVFLWGLYWDSIPSVCAHSKRGRK